MILLEESFRKVDLYVSVMSPGEEPKEVPAVNRVIRGSSANKSKEKCLNHGFKLSTRNDQYAEALLSTQKQKSA